MDFIRFRSIGEILYEVMTGLLFYPRTLWRVLLQPAEVSAEIDRAADSGQPAVDLVSPPLFLILSILAAHALDLVMRSALEPPAPVPAGNLLLLRLLAFSLLPLVMAAGTVRREGRPVDHATLRPAFDLQCFYVAPFALSASVAAVLIRSPVASMGIAGVALAVAAVAWHLCVQTRWLGGRLSVGRVSAFRTALWLSTVALFFSLVSAPLILGLPGARAA
jgi:hypothetical protein